MTNGIIPGLVLPKHEFYKDPFIMTCHGLLYSAFSSSHTFPYYGARNLPLLLLLPFVLIPGALKQVFRYSNILMRDLWLQSWGAKTWWFRLHCSCSIENELGLNLERNFPMYELSSVKKKQKQNQNPKKPKTKRNKKRTPNVFAATVLHNRLLNFQMYSVVSLLSISFSAAQEPFTS